MSDETFRNIVSAYNRAIAKHPVFAENKEQAAAVIQEELDELKHAIRHESRERQKAEALDVMITALRFWLGEYERE